MGDAAVEGASAAEVNHFKGIGIICQNISLFVYFVYFAPQLMRSKPLQISLVFQAMLFLTTCMDLTSSLPNPDLSAQYRMVAGVMFSCLLVQEVQMFLAARRWHLKANSRRSEVPAPINQESEVPAPIN